jgi:L-aspartate oxidase
VPAFLISEAVRGEGGYLLSAKTSERFMLGQHELAELAPRDVLARAIARQMLKDGTDHVWLDVRHLPAAKVTARFPQIYRYCLDQGLDISASPIPVAPAAHYMMGGIRTDAWGRSTIPRLFACGEAACTGVHGANRLASNSLLETVVFAERVVAAAASSAWPGLQPGTIPVELRGLAPSARSGTVTARPALQEVQRLMWACAGIVRDGSGLAEARTRLAAWQRSLPPPTDRASSELAGILTIGRLLIEAALAREESRGAHFRSDFPEPSDGWLRHLAWVSAP